MNVLGISCDYHDAAAALVIDGDVRAAVEEERLTRRKHDHSIPARSVASCLAIAGIDADDLDAVVFHEKPLLVASRVFAARQRRGPMAIGSFAKEFPVLLRDNALIAHRVDRVLRTLGARRPPRLSYCEHHLSHAAAAFYPSPFETAAVLTVDGIGEWTTATLGTGSHHRLDVLEEQRYPHSLGLIYSLVTLWCGFEPNDGEYKLMGLAPFGEPTMLDRLERVAMLDDRGGVKVDSRAVRWWGGDLRSSRRLRGLLGPARRPGEPITQHTMDLARSMQAFTEDALLRMADHAYRRTGESALCLGGGVALNCAATGRIQRESAFDRVWVQPAAGDAGSALGAALWYTHESQGRHRRPSSLAAGAGTALGPAFDSAEIVAWLETLDVPWRREPDLGRRCREVAERLARGEVVGWFEGRMEFGPRALGRRSILADPRDASMQRDLNLRVKGRNDSRPFAPAVLWEAAEEWFDLDAPSPNMSFVHRVSDAHLGARPPETRSGTGLDDPGPFVSDIPACTHVDGTARVQTVHRESSPAFHRLLSEFESLTGCPVLLNTSFNRAGEPIVCTPDDALGAARAAHLDVLVVEDCLIDLGAGRPS